MNLLLMMLIGLIFHNPYTRESKEFDDRLMLLNRLEDDPTMIASLQDYMD
jgi:hypothetical protein